MALRNTALVAISVAILASLAGQLIMAGEASGLGLGMNIMESIQGHAAMLTLSNGPVQRFTLRWENIGSVNCLSRARIDFYALADNDTLEERVYTSWSSQEPVMAGQSHTWELYSNLPGGSYAAITMVYHCNELFEEEPYLFTVPGSEPVEGLYIDSIEVHSDYVDALVRGPGWAGGVAVIPEEYPGGWIFQSGVVDMAPGGVAVVRLGFVPVRLTGTAVTIRAVAMDGSVYGKREFSVSVPKEEPAREWGSFILLLASLAVILVVILYVSKFIIKIWRRQ